MPAAAGDGLSESPPRFLLGEKAPVQLEESFLPSCVSNVSRETLRNFQHTKRVGNYLIGRKLGEGSFAKVREGLHVVTGERVRHHTILCVCAILLCCVNICSLTLHYFCVPTQK